MNTTGTPDPTATVRKPLMSTRQILLMNFGFFGIQYSFGLQQNAIGPIYSFLHASPEDLPFLFLAGPITGILIQPLIGALSDRTWSPRWGRRKPFFLIGAIGCSIFLFLFPFVTALWMAVLLMWLLDVSNNTAMEPYRAFIADKLSSSQVGKGFLVQSAFTGLGVALVTGSVNLFNAVIKGGTEAGIPYWVFGAFMVGAVCSISSVLVSVLSTPENPPTPQELAELRSKKGGLGASLAEIARAARDMPANLWKLAIVYLFQWFAMFAYWQYIPISVAKTVFHTTPADTTAYSDAVAWTTLVNGFYNVIACCSAFFLVIMAKRYGAKWVHAACLTLAAAGVLTLPHVENKYLLLIPIIGLGIGWASMMGVPYILIVASIPKERYGVYMGIVNIMICVPQMIETLRFGEIYRTFLHSDPQAAITLTGIFLLIAAFAMLWIRQTPRKHQEGRQFAAPIEPTPTTT
jgi:maltose/moltooligosaccharide transporter